MATVFYLYRSTKENAPLTVRLAFRYKEKDFVFGANSQISIYSKDEILKNPNLNALAFWKTFFSAKPKKAKDINDVNKLAELNILLKSLENHILNQLEKIPFDLVTKQWLEDTISEFHKPKEESVIPNTLIEFIDYYLQMNNHLKHGTSKKFVTLKNKLISRKDKFPKGIILLNEINDNFKLIFEKIFSDYNKNTISRNLTDIKTLIRYADSKGLAVNKEVFKWKLKIEKTPFVYLNEDEIQILHEKNNLPEYLDNVKDWLVISCMTGQRISDFMRFTKNMIRYQKNKDGKEIPLIEFTQVKTGKNVTVPLHPIVMEILEKRNGEFPRPISSQNYNEWVKLVAEEVGFDEKVYGSKVTILEDGTKRTEKGYFPKYQLISSHCGRRSYACNYYGKVPTSLIMNITAHSSEKMFLNYIHKSSADQALNMADYF